MTAGSVIGKLLTPSLALAAAAVLLPTSGAMATQVDLTVDSSGTIGDANFVRADTLPAGTGVFKPFLTLQNSPIEQGYNTSGADVLDTKRVPQWNHDLTKGDLAVVDGYYVFELDANETGTGSINRLLSVDNIRIYTSPIGAQTDPNPDNLGKLRYSLNDPIKDASGNYIIDNWVKLDASRFEFGSTSGSGSSDMLVYIPAKYLDAAANSDYVYFYNLNGVHYTADPGTSSDAGFEEWRALTSSVPDGGNTLALLGSAVTALGFVASRRKMAKQA